MKSSAEVYAIKSDIEVVNLAIAIFPWGAAFQVVDSLQACNSGCLRGMGRADIAAVFNFVAYYRTYYCHKSILPPLSVPDH